MASRRGAEGDARLDELAEELHSAMLSILQCRPDNPLMHLAAHFSDLVHGASPVAAAYRRLRLCAPEAPQFGDNLFEAFDMLAEGSDGIAPDVFMAFVALLISGLRPQLAVQLQRVCSDIAQLTVDYGTFQAAARVCLLVEQLATPEGCEGRSFVLAEARELLLELVERQEWLASIEVPPLHSIAALQQVPVDSCSRGLDAAVEAEAHAAAVDKLLKTAAAV